MNTFFMFLFSVVPIFLGNWEKHELPAYSISIELPSKPSKIRSSIAEYRIFSYVDSNATAILDITKITFENKKCVSSKDSLKTCFKEYLYNKSKKKVRIGTHDVFKRDIIYSDYKYIVYKRKSGIIVKEKYKYNKWTTTVTNYQCFIYKGYFIIQGMSTKKQLVQNYTEDKNYYFNSLEFL